MPASTDDDIYPTGLYLLDVQTGEFLEEPLIENSAALVMDWHPDGQHIAEWVSTEDTPIINVWRWDGDGSAEKILSFEPSGQHHLAKIVWSPACDALAMSFVVGDGAIVGAQVWTVSLDPPSAQLESIYIAHQPDEPTFIYATRVLEWSADGTRILTSKAPGSLEVWER
jgi:WD40 repeat protein